MADVKDKAEEQAGEKPAAASAAVPAAGTGAPAGAADAKGAPRTVRGRGARLVPFGIAHVRATFNNTIICITDSKGGVIAWSTSGRAGFKGSRKSTAFAASVVAQEAARQAVSRGMQEVEVRVQGPGAGRESAIRALQAAGLNLTVIKDVTPMPHNGCRPRKRRRV
jgi:small subunit ribosomal protein S11